MNKHNLNSLGYLIPNVFKVGIIGLNSLFKESVDENEMNN